MRMQSVLYVPATLLALLFLIVVVAFGAIVSITRCNRRPTFSYFADGISGIAPSN
jgi:hypothetical protein